MALPITLRTFTIGTVAGLRSMTAPAATLLARNSVWAGPVAFAAAGEMIVDKLPVAPARTLPPALAVRVLSGALCGRALAGDGGTAKLLGLACGAAGALAGSYGGYALRHYLTSQRVWPDTPVALVEDLLTIGLARAATA